MSRPIRVLLQTTIPTSDDDWHIGRFSMLGQLLAEATDRHGRALFEVSMRDRGASDRPDPLLSEIDHSNFDEIWLFAVDTGDGLHAEDCQAIERFRLRGGGLLVARDHMDLGCSVCGLGDVGAANYFHTHNLDPDASRHHIDDRVTANISWPNFHSGANGDWQSIEAEGDPHAVLFSPEGRHGVLRYLPSHPHEGAVGVPAGDETARIVARGQSKVSGSMFNLAIAFEPTTQRGPAVAQSTFHHFADYNWDTRMGAPSFVSEPPGHALLRHAGAMASTRRYALNAALWLGGREVTLAA
ncbi:MULTISPECIES: hypothetical protein [Dyella]|uniref:ThuA-like domain-containing protein n=2 Tax=Dyella TaxID=231454 RepID=A0A4R0YWI6_9GAMM|nr:MULTISPECIES: hypothetical protein [Dyella]TBR39503.1 hypothetical protein EYV96_04635 [Dyella terrae]TCI12911.1 hypothetical protein EZM97_06235 [Dyella soli]